jgi:hypothetical protein
MPEVEAPKMPDRKVEFNKDHWNSPVVHCPHVPVIKSTHEPWGSKTLRATGVDAVDHTLPPGALSTKFRINQRHETRHDSGVDDLCSALAYTEVAAVISDLMDTGFTTDSARDTFTPDDGKFGGAGATGDWAPDTTESPSYDSPDTSYSND